MKKNIQNIYKILGFSFFLVVLGLSLNVALKANDAEACADQCFPPPSGYCSAGVSQAYVGDTVTWKV